MALLLFSPSSSGPPSNRFRIGSMQMTSGGSSGKRVWIASTARATPLASSSIFTLGVAIRLSRAAARTPGGSRVLWKRSRR